MFQLPFCKIQFRVSVTIQPEIVSEKTYNVFSCLPMLACFKSVWYVILRFVVQSAGKNSDRAKGTTSCREGIRSTPFVQRTESQECWCDFASVAKNGLEWLQHERLCRKRSLQHCQCKIFVRCSFCLSHTCCLLRFVLMTFFVPSVDFLEAKYCIAVCIPLF